VFDKNKDKRIKNFMAQYDEQQAGKVERERREAMKKNQDAMKSAFAQIQKEFNQFRNTSQQSIMSGSVEAMRLRSRRFVNSGGVDYAQMTAEYNKTQVKTLGDILKEMTAATNKLTNISTSGVPIKGLSVRSH
jgi:coproporphyrinogen III oxidase